jgi:hypothetical protein
VQKTAKKTSEAPAVIPEETTVKTVLSSHVSMDKKTTDDGSASPLSGELFSQTRLRVMSSQEVSALTADQLRYAINEVYARYGATFPKTPEIQRHFERLSWYHPNPRLSFEDIDRSMTDIERENVKMLALYREGLRKH